MNVEHRRRLLKIAALAGAGRAIGVKTSLGQDAGQVPVWTRKVVDFLNIHARSDRGYAWEDQDRSHLTPSFAVVGCYQALGLKPSGAEELAKFIRTHHPRELKKLEQEHHDFEYQQIQSLVWLGEDVVDFRAAIQTWSEPHVYLKQYEQHGYPVFRSECGVFVCRSLVGLPIEQLNPAFVTYLDSRRRANGSFNNTPNVEKSDGHILNTLWGLQALRTLNRHQENRDATIEWIQQCQLPSGGFTWQPQADFARMDDVAYTWGAVRALKLLDASPISTDDCIRYLHSLWHEDGGFSDRPNWQTNPLATYYAVDTLKMLGALDSLSDVQVAPASNGLVIRDDLRVYSILLEAHGQGSPIEAVDLAKNLKIHLWGAKNAKPEWLARAQAIADSHNVPVRFFIANEEYGTWVDTPGLGTYSHTSDIIAEDLVSANDSLANQGVVSWNEFHRRRYVPLHEKKGRLIWQFGENEELVRLFLDDSLERGGYAGISTFHFGNPDFTNSEPFLYRWQGQIPFVSIHDAHGPEPWWFADQTSGFRTVFLATEPSWQAWLEALRDNRVAAVRRDAASQFETWMHGSPQVREYLRRHELEWRWWDNPEIQRPLVSLVAVEPQDPFEVASDEKAITLRVRCGWTNTVQGAPKTPLVEFISLTLDDQVVPVQLETHRSNRTRTLSDHYHYHTLGNIVSGEHRATVTVRILETGAVITRSIRFEA